MPLYFLELEARLFRERLVPALAACWRQRSFAPGLELAASLVSAGREFVPSQREESLLSILPTLPFDRDLWRLAAGEVLLFAAAQVPVVPTAAQTLRHLLNVRESDSRARAHPIEQAHFGSRDLVFGGGYYRPEHAGLNDESDVPRLAQALAGIETSGWLPAQLVGLEQVDPLDREEELAYARDCLGALLSLYEGASARGAVIVCERI